MHHETRRCTQIRSAGGSPRGSPGGPPKTRRCSRRMRLMVLSAFIAASAVRPPFALRARILSATSEYFGPSGRGGFGAFDSELLPAGVPPFALRARILSTIPEYLGPNGRGGFGAFDPELLASAIDAATAAPVSPCNCWALWGAAAAAAAAASAPLRSATFCMPSSIWGQVRVRRNPEAAWTVARQ